VQQNLHIFPRSITACPGRKGT